VATARALRHDLPDAHIIHLNTSDTKAITRRLGEFAQHADAGKKTVLVVPFHASRVGIEFVDACRMIVVSPHMTIKEAAQLQGRIVRAGQTRPVIITMLHMPGTFDDVRGDTGAVPHLASHIRNSDAWRARMLQRIMAN
jgi:hypothetical protein